MTDAALLRLHREITAVPSISGNEGNLVRFLETWFEARGLSAERVGDSLLVLLGDADADVPLLVFDSHLDTVPPGSAWTRDPFTVHTVEGRVHGLGSNDAKASVAAMIAAAVRLAPLLDSLKLRIALCLAAAEETSNAGTADLLGRLRSHSLFPYAAVVGEPTGLDLAVAQKGLLVLELKASGIECHAAHRAALGGGNAILALARDLRVLGEADLGPADLLLGPVTLEPTVLSGGSARNVVPGAASCILDVRTNPAPSTAELLENLRARVEGELVCRSDRLIPFAVAPDASIVRAALAARPQARSYGSRTLSDLIHFGGIPALKAGPGMTERSHTPDEFVLESEIIEGARFYEAVARAYATLAGKEETRSAPLGSR